jgi:hypothetical protein
VIGDRLELPIGDLPSLVPFDETADDEVDRFDLIVPVRWGSAARASAIGVEHGLASGASRERRRGGVHRECPWVDCVIGDGIGVIWKNRAKSACRYASARRHAGAKQRAVDAVRQTWTMVKFLRPPQESGQENIH